MSNMHLKICSVCKKTKHFNNFHKSKVGKFKRQGHCKTCSLVLTREYRKQNPEKMKIVDRKKYIKNKKRLLRNAKFYYRMNKERLRLKRKHYYNKNRHKSREWCIKTKYNLSKIDYNNMLKNQKNKCLLCLIPFKNITPSVDHCHKSGKVRGLLCRFCNLGLGAFKDNSQILKRASKYVNKI
jgi:hypothetical protein